MMVRTQPDESSLRWDIFCNVIDNFGDIGVCWRLAKQLANEHSVHVRLWINDLATFGRIQPSVDPEKPRQTCGAIEVFRWQDGQPDFADVAPGDVVVEAFACRLPEDFVERMAARKQPPVWINLDYLSAETWIEGCHRLPSPHPRLPLVKYFFFPGFTDATGGLLREACLDEKRETFRSSDTERADFWQKLGFAPPPKDAVLVSLFSYENPAICDLLGYWSAGERPVCCLLPLTRNTASVETFLGESLQVGRVARRGSLELRVLPFVLQEEYDQILWLSNLNLVRGEDSFIRAQWAEKPFIWHIYAQDDQAHLVKLDAFLDRYTLGLSDEASHALRNAHHEWNAGQFSRQTFMGWSDAQPELRRHAIEWANRLKKKQDLCGSLVSFCRSKL